MSRTSTTFSQILFLGLNSVILQYCGDCSYTIEKGKISSGCHDFEFLKLSKVTVDSFIQGVPVEYSIDTTVLTRKLTKDRSSVISFVSPNDNYDFFFFKPYEPDQTFRLFPITFRTNQWYMIESLQNEAGFFGHNIYFYFNEKGELIRRDKIEHGPY